jgi:hypothetical protein
MPDMRDPAVIARINYDMQKQRAEFAEAEVADLREAIWKADELLREALVSATVSKYVASLIRDAREALAGQGDTDA